MCLISKQKQSIKRDPSDIKNSLIIRRGGLSALDEPVPLMPRKPPIAQDFEAMQAESVRCQAGFRARRVYR
jgi:hypothetical protein